MLGVNNQESESTVKMGQKHSPKYSVQNLIRRTFKHRQELIVTKIYICLVLSVRSFVRIFVYLHSLDTTPTKDFGPPPPRNLGPPTPFNNVQNSKKKNPKFLFLVVGVINSFTNEFITWINLKQRTFEPTFTWFSLTLCSWNLTNFSLLWILVVWRTSQWLGRHFISSVFNLIVLVLDLFEYYYTKKSSTSFFHSNPRSLPSKYLAQAQSLVSQTLHHLPICTQLSTRWKVHIWVGQCPPKSHGPYMWILNLKQKIIKAKVNEQINI